MNGFFTDNQTKQKAYDSYYNAMARSDFVQGRKLKALIEKENADDATTENLASLFQKAMSKTRNYEYDEITKELRKKAPAVLANGVDPAKASKAKKSIPIPTKKGGKKTKSPKKFTFIPQTTDTEMKSAAPLTPSPTKSTPDFNMVTPPRRNSSPESKAATPPPRRASSAKNFESKDWKPSVVPNILSPNSMAKHKAKKQAEELKEAAYAQEADNDSKFFPNLFGTSGTTAADNESAAAKIEEHNDLENIQKLAKQMAREEWAARAPLSGRFGKRTVKPREKMSKKETQKQILKALNAKRFGYLNKNEKVAAAKEIDSMVEDVLNDMVGNLENHQKVQEEITKADKRKRIPTPDDKTPTNPKSTKVCLYVPPSPLPPKNLAADFDEARSDRTDSFNADIQREIDESKKLRPVDNKARDEFGQFISTNSGRTAPVSIYKDFKVAFGKYVKDYYRDVKGYASDKVDEIFEREFPLPVRKNMTESEAKNYIHTLTTKFNKLYQ